MQIDQFLQVYSKTVGNKAHSLKLILKVITDRYNITWEKKFVQKMAVVLSNLKTIAR